MRRTREPTSRAADGVGRTHLGCDVLVKLNMDDLLDFERTHLPLIIPFLRIGKTA